jgi:hypothetical protein
MKTIQFRTENKTLWTINTKQITALSNTDTEKGTTVHLTCGTKLYTLLSTSVLLEMINKKDEIDLED